jgi:hypothetical protein
MANIQGMKMFNDKAVRTKQQADVAIAGRRIIVADGDSLNVDVRLTQDDIDRITVNLRQDGTLNYNQHAGITDLMKWVRSVAHHAIDSVSG